MNATEIRGGLHGPFSCRACQICTSESAPKEASKNTCAVESTRSTMRGRIALQPELCVTRVAVCGYGKRGII
eukprot:6472088-Amphidinium_carterae.1